MIPERGSSEDPQREPSDEATSQMVQLVAPLWSEDRTRNALGLSSGDLRAAVRQGNVLALPLSDGPPVFPLWQFVTTSRGVEVRPAMRSMLAHLARHDPWTVAMVLCTAAPELGGRSARDVMRDSKVDIELLAEFAEIIGGEFSAGTPN